MANISRRRDHGILLQAVLFTAGAVCAVPGLLLIRDPDSVYAFRFSLIYVHNIRQASVIETYLRLRALALTAAFAGPLVMAVLAWLCAAGPRGLRITALASTGFSCCLCGLAGFLGLLFVYKAGAYSIRAIRANLAVLIFSMLLLEGILASVDAMLLFWLIRLTRRGGETADALYYMALSGKADAGGIDPSVYRGLFLLGAGLCILGLLRLPDTAGALALILWGSGLLFMGWRLRKRRQEMEWAQYQEEVKKGK